MNTTHFGISMNKCFYMMVFLALISCGGSNNDPEIPLIPEPKVPTNPEPEEPSAPETLVQPDGTRQGYFSQPRMHIEGDKLFVCTSQGLYAKDLAKEGSVYQLVGFKGIPLQDYVRRGNDILALRYNRGRGFLLLSHDDGQTYEDITPDIFCKEDQEVLPSIVQHPTDYNTLLVSSLYYGVFRSKDFGKTWEQLTDHLWGNANTSQIGFHPTQPNIIYNSGESMIMSGNINISYDDGKTWNNHGESLGFPGDNCVHRPAFHPTNPNHWVIGGEGCVFTTDDNGETWSVQNYWDDNSKVAYWYFAEFDNKNPDIVYLVGPLDNSVIECKIKIMCSTDGGQSWNEPLRLPMMKAHDWVNDLLQYKDRLFIYAETGIYEVAKSDIIK